MQRKTILSRLAGAAGILLAAGPAAPAADSSVSLVPLPPPPPLLWQKQCDQTAAEHPCWVEQFAIAMPNKVVVAHVRFDIQQGGKTGIIVFAPLGVALIPGLQLILDGGKPIALPYERCSAEGCDASAVLDQEAVEKFEQGKILTVRYAVADAKTTDIPIRLEGLTAALGFLSH